MAASGSKAFAVTMVGVVARGQAAPREARPALPDGAARRTPGSFDERAEARGTAKDSHGGMISRPGPDEPTTGAVIVMANYRDAVMDWRGQCQQRYLEWIREEAER